MRSIVRDKQRRAGGNRAQSAFQSECQYDLGKRKAGSFSDAPIHQCDNAERTRR